MWNKKFLIGTLIGLSVLAIGCGKTSFQISPHVEYEKAPGGILVPPKVDVLFVMDDTGSVYGSVDSLMTSVRGFLNQLDGMNWDYHFAVSRLTTFSSISQVTASRYDSNWGSSWNAAYPGQKSNEPGMVSPSAFQFPNNYNGFYSWSSGVSNNGNGSEPGLETLKQTLSGGFGNTGFLRSDALLAVVIVSNGNDTSGVNYCPRPIDGVMMPCNDGSEANSLNYYKTWLKSFKTNMKVYAAVAQNSGSCLGGSGWAGTRYMAVADKSFNLCSASSIGNVLSTIAGEMKATQLDYEESYLAMDQEPNPASIKVTKYIGGNTAYPVVIPQDSVDGWTYVGKTTTYSITKPIPMNQITGYLIKLNGSAVLKGGSTASIEYTPAGAENAVSK